MANGRTLIVYGTRYGQTEKIARHMAERLTDRGLGITLARVNELPDDVEPADYGAVIVGAPVYIGKHLRGVRKFVEKHADALNDVVSAFFSVSGAAAGPGDEDRELAMKKMADFLESAGWTPDHTATIGGAINYTQYGFITRWFMKRINASRGRGADTSLDYEYTNWDQVDRFADAVARAAPGGSPTGGGAPTPAG